MTLKVLSDKDGSTFYLYPEVWAHIKKYHPEIDSTSIIDSILKYPDVIVQSRWDEFGHLYYKRFGSVYRVVMVQIREQRIKTTLTTDTVKRGDILWVKKTTGG